MTAAYNGVRTIQIKTFTTTYNQAVSPWIWAQNSLQPMEFAGQLGPAPNFGSIGFAGAVFSDAVGATSFHIGDLLSGTTNNNMGAAIWENGKLYGWSIGSSGSPTPQTFSYNLPLDGADHVAPFSVGLTFFVPLGHNAPNAYAGYCYRTFDDLLMISYNGNGIPTVDQGYGFWDLANTTSPGTGYIYPYNQNAVNDGVIPYAGANYVMTGFQGGQPGPAQIVKTDFKSYSVGYPMALVNPPGSSVDLSSLINTTNIVSMACYGGWLWFFETPLSITGKNFDGYGVYVTPDFASYQLFEIVGTDSLSMNWHSLLGDVVGKFDSSGILWMKAAGNAKVIFKSLAVPASILPVFPPVCLPSPPNDSETMLRAYQGYGQ